MYIQIRINKCKANKASKSPEKFYLVRKTYENISNFSAYGWTMEQEFNAKSIKYCKIFSCEEEMGDTIDVKLSDMVLSFGDLESPQVKIKSTWKFSIPTKYKNCSVDLAKGQKLKLGGTKLTLKNL